MASDRNWTIAPAGDCCLIITFGQRVDVHINERVHGAAQRLLQAAVPGVRDIVPAFTTVSVHYQPECFAQDGLPYDHLCRQIEALLDIEDSRGSGLTVRTVDMPVCYGGDFGPDLPEVARLCGLTPEQVVERHLASPHRVYMLGFLPGLPYIGGLDPQLRVPRRSKPRIRVPAGSVAIANDQTCIYPLESPGGWHLIGRTPLALFDVRRAEPCTLQPGDRVRFVPVAPADLKGSP
ncbi:5-oxoprolinase subunit PxpB [Castellaniella sp.]|uniref:5-oxoprolinase subunit PxpB n=1 Tax=Castellaniella sp. TaxID=1955812 RepID=UPI00356B3399